MRDDRFNQISFKSLREMRAVLREAGMGREFGRGVRRRTSRLVRVLIVAGAGMVALSVGSVLSFKQITKMLGIPLSPTYRIYSFRWWAEELVVAGVMFGVPLLLLSVSAYFVQKRQASLRASAAVEMGFCGGCGYKLAGLEREEDGCVVCPECGAAWKSVLSSGPLS